MTALSKPALIPAINQIVVGDVGSGKTIVAFLVGLTFLHGLKQGQVAMLAPTEVLAYQHYKKLVELAQSHDQIKEVQLLFVTNKQLFWNNEKITKGQFTKKLAQEKPSKIFWLGTQALLFRNDIRPDLVLVDEQHRFGVRQRQLLVDKYREDSDIAHAAHFVSFTATPIPRTLALTIYRSLKPHFLNTLSFRKPIATNIILFSDLEKKAVPLIREEIFKNRKIYIICPRIEEKDDADEMWSIQKAEQFFTTLFPNEILIVHGKQTEKKEILDEFKTSDAHHILIATTVIEVGVDVPQASLMIILNAERFGLAALHQIRGRVGRNDFVDNRCLLVTQDGGQYSKRLKYVCQYHDGFSLAQKDLELRGSGTMLGRVQSGFGDEIDEILGLEPQKYEQITQLVDHLNWVNLQHELPRLNNYVNKKLAEVWEE